MFTNPYFQRIPMPEQSATRYLQHNKVFKFRRGGSLPQLTLAYETWGKLDRDHSNAVMILTGISPSAHAASAPLDTSEGWWEPSDRAGKPIDTRQNFVVCINSLGSCKGSTGPASINPETGKPYRLAFPELTIWDIANAAQLVLEHLGIKQLRMMVGPSMGGMSGLAWLYQNPMARDIFWRFFSRRAEPFSIAIRSLQREAIVTDPKWHEGNYTTESWPENGMRLARKLGMITYRSAREWRTRFGRQEQNNSNRKFYGMNLQSRVLPGKRGAKVRDAVRSLLLCLSVTRDGLVQRGRWPSTVCKTPWRT